ncbi:hypothetical protein REPUB_Repub09cG0118900 [Reevesia pubescens]
MIASNIGAMEGNSNSISQVDVHAVTEGISVDAIRLHFEDSQLVGVGKSLLVDIPIFGDRWVVKPPKYLLDKKDDFLPTPMSIAFFINQEKRTWKADLIVEMCTERDVGIIQHMPLAKKECKDTLIWPKTLLGTFTVKSAYYVACVMLEERCVVCGQYGESWRHVLFTYPFSKVVWQGTSTWILQILEDVGEPMAIWKRFLNVASSKSELELVLTHL